jgi:apolipoprotein N-acyltransferase
LKNTILGFFFSVTAAIFSGILLILAFPNYHLSWLAWVGLVPLLIALDGKKLTYAFVVALVCGIVYFAGNFDWMFKVPGYKFYHQAILTTFMGLYFGLFGLVFNFTAKRLGPVHAHLSAPFVWVLLEYLRSHFFFLALPWVLLAHTQYQVRPLIQIGAIAGEYGISFLIVLVNATIALNVLYFFPQLRRHATLDQTAVSKNGIIVLTLTSIGLIILALGYGAATLIRPVPQDTIQLSVLQGNIEQSKKWDPRYAKFVMDVHTELSRKASKSNPALIVWPEASTPGFVLAKKTVLNQIVSLVKETNTHYIIGSAEFPKFVKGIPRRSMKGGNSALFFSPEGKVLGQYIKIRLYPFGEYVPYDGIIPWPEFIIPQEKRKSQMAGKEYKLFQLAKSKFGVVICWEIAFPRLFSTFVKNGAEFMVNISNEAWFGESQFSEQFLAVCVLRAVENRIAIARAGNTGISCFIDPSGKVTGRVVKNNKDIFVRGYLTRAIPISHERTFYTVYGDVFVYISIAVTLAVIFLSFIRAKKKS